MSSRRGVVLLSGGIDSSVVLKWAVSQGFNIHALFFDYGQPAAAVEREYSERIASDHGATYFTAIDICQEIYELPDKETFEFPFRNMVLLSAAAAFASRHKRYHVFIGVNDGSDSAVSYPDCESHFIEGIQACFSLCDEDLKLHAPLIDVTKSGVCGLAKAFELRSEEMFSCLTPTRDGRACKLCVSCCDREVNWS